MENNTDEIIEKLKGLRDQFKEHQSEAWDLENKQVEVIDKLIEDNKPIFQWIKNESDFFFTHPTLNYRSKAGPILGYQESDHRLVVYDVEKESLKITDIGEKYASDKPTISLQLVRNGHFTTAVEGLTYIEEMFKEYVQRIAKTIDKLKKELDIVND